MVYELMNPPFKFESYDTLTKKQAEELYEWYIGEIPFRLAQLQQYIDIVSKQKVRLNKEPSSLVPLWGWFESMIKTRKKTREEIKKELEGSPEWLHKEIKKDKREFTTETLTVGMDIAIYFAEVFIHNNPLVRWGLRTKERKSISFNKPVLFGFIKDMNLDPRHIVHTCMYRSLEKKNKNELIEAYDVWLTYIKQ